MRGKKTTTSPAKVITQLLPRTVWCPVSLWAKTSWLKPHPQFLLQSTTLHGLEFSFGQVGSPGPAVLPHNSLSSAFYLWGTNRVRNREGVDAVLVSVTVKTLCSYQYWFSHKSKTQPHMVSYNENELCPSQTQIPLCSRGEKADGQVHGNSVLELKITIVKKLRANTNVIWVSFTSRGYQYKFLE